MAKILEIQIKVTVTCGSPDPHFPDDQLVEMAKDDIEDALRFIDDDGWLLKSVELVSPLPAPVRTQNKALEDAANSLHTSLRKSDIPFTCVGMTSDSLIVYADPLTLAQNFIKEHQDQWQTFPVCVKEMGTPQALAAEPDAG